MPDRPPYYLTTPIYYVNARPHLGHTYTTVVADVIARRKRALGFDVRFLTGTDEHGQKIERSAKKAKCTPQEFADRVSAEFRGLWDRMELSYDDYIRTTEERHRRGVQKLFSLLQERGFIYKGTYTGQYNIQRLVYFEYFRYVRSAIAREKELKHWTREQKIRLIEKTNPTWAELMPTPLSLDGEAGSLRE